MIGLMADAGDNFKKRATIPLAPCMWSTQPAMQVQNPLQIKKKFKKKSTPALIDSSLSFRVFALLALA
jgi:hypothetical protein